MSTTYFAALSLLEATQSSGEQDRTSVNNSSGELWADSTSPEDFINAATRLTSFSSQPSWHANQSTYSSSSTFSGAFEPPRPYFATPSQQAVTRALPPTQAPSMQWAAPPPSYTFPPQLLPVGPPPFSSTSRIRDLDDGSSWVSPHRPRWDSHVLNVEPEAYRTTFAPGAPHPLLAASHGGYALAPTYYATHQSSLFAPPAILRPTTSEEPYLPTPPSSASTPTFPPLGIPSFPTHPFSPAPFPSYTSPLAYSPSEPPPSPLLFSAASGPVEPPPKKRQKKEDVDDKGRSISKITGQPTRVLSKRAFPPKDAAKRVYVCGFEGCTKSCEFSLSRFSSVLRSGELGRLFSLGRARVACASWSVCELCASGMVGFVLIFRWGTQLGGRRRGTRTSDRTLEKGVSSPLRCGVCCAGEVADGCSCTAFMCPVATCARPFSVFSNLKRHMLVRPFLSPSSPPTLRTSTLLPQSSTLLQSSSSLTIFPPSLPTSPLCLATPSQPHLGPSSLPPSPLPPSPLSPPTPSPSTPLQHPLTPSPLQIHPEIDFRSMKTRDLLPPSSSPPPSSSTSPPKSSSSATSGETLRSGRGVRWSNEAGVGNDAEGVEQGGWGSVGGSEGWGSVGGSGGWGEGSENGGWGMLGERG